MIGLSHVRWLVADLEPCRVFYRDRLGLRQVVNVPGVYAEFETTGARIALYRADLMAAVVGGPASTQRADDVVLCLAVDDVDRAAAQLARAGATLVKAPHDQAAWHQRVAHFCDPVGHLIELWSPLPTRQNS
jgi:catechol 2,3-dioxygenase-like lactoylglutathione lyase family enzyme